MSCTCARKSHSQHLQSDELELWPDGIWLSSVPSQGLVCTVSLPNFSWKGTCRGKMRDIGSVLLAWRFACHFLFLCFWRIKNEAEKEKEGKRSIIYTTNDYYYYSIIMAIIIVIMTNLILIVFTIYIYMVVGRVYCMPPCCSSSSWAGRLQADGRGGRGCNGVQDASDTATWLKWSPGR